MKSLSTHANLKQSKNKCASTYINMLLGSWDLLHPSNPTLEFVTFRGEQFMKAYLSLIYQILLSYNWRILCIGMNNWRRVGMLEPDMMCAERDNHISAPTRCWGEPSSRITNLFIFVTYAFIAALSSGLTDRMLITC